MNTSHKEKLGESSDSIQKKIISENSYCIEYAKTSIAKCRNCKKAIEKNMLRLGKYTIFKGKVITHFYAKQSAF